MFSKKVYCPTTPAQITDKCVCDVPVKVRKTFEQIEADKILKELFRGDMRKDIFKLCTDLGKVAYDDRDKKSSTTSVDSSSRKSHFLPPLYSDEGESYYEMHGEMDTGDGGVIDDWRRFQMGLGMNIDMDYDPNDAYKRRKSSDDDQYHQKRKAGKGKKRDYDPNAHKRKSDDDPNALKGKGKGKGDRNADGEGDGKGDGKEDGEGDGKGERKGDGKGVGDDDDYDSKGYGKYDDDKDGKDLTDEQKRRGIKFSDSSHSRGSKDFKESMFDKYQKYGMPMKFPISDEDRDRLGLRKDIYDEIQEDFLGMGEEDMGESRYNKYEFLLKYYQLQKLAEKLKARAEDTRAARVRGDNDYEDGYRVGFAEGHKKAYIEDPLDYRRMSKADQQHYALTDTQGRRKTIYITTHPEDIDELKKIFQDVNIEQCKTQKFSTETEKLIAKKVEMYLKEYRQTLLASKSPHFKLGFVDGFYDAYYQTFIYNPSDESFDNDEKFYVSEVRKCISFSDDMGFDYKSILKRAADLKVSVHGINLEEYEEEMRRRKPKPKTDKEKKKKKSRVLPPCLPTLLPPERRFPVLPEMPQIAQDLHLMFPVDKTRKTKMERAADYMDRHRIADIFRYMGTMLCAYKPDDPIDFLINLLDKCLMFRVSEIPEQAPLVFTPKHVASIYNEMDPFHVGYIDGMQYLYGLNLLEVAEEDDENVENEDTIEMNQFLSNANNRLLEKFKEMIAICAKEDKSYARIYQ